MSRYCYGLAAVIQSIVHCLIWRSFLFSSNGSTGETNHNSQVEVISEPPILYEFSFEKLEEVYDGGKIKA
mgnify:CR=1 FL=1